MDLKGKVAIITGASRGIGKAIALKLAKEGADIVIASKSDKPNPKLPGTIHEVAKEVGALGRSALAIPTDVRNVEDIDRMVEKTLQAFGRVDILINNAGALWWYPVTETPPGRFDLVMGVNVRAAFFCARAVLPKMMEQKWGHIVNMSPPIDYSLLSGKVGYCISKFGMTMLSMGLAEEMKDHNIAVNSLWPATVIESQATINFQLGDPSCWRKSDIMSDATYYLVRRDPKKTTGRALIDEEILVEEGITDFEPYNCVPGGTPMRIIQGSWHLEAGKTEEKKKE